MPESTTTPLEITEMPSSTRAAPPDEGLVEESLVEEVSIDGMCGVY